MRTILGLYISLLLISIGPPPVAAVETPPQAGHYQLAKELDQFNQALTFDTLISQSVQELDDNNDADPQTANPAMVLVSSLIFSILFLSASLYGFKYYKKKSLST